MYELSVLVKCKYGDGLAVEGRRGRIVHLTKYEHYRALTLAGTGGARPWTEGIRGGTEGGSPCTERVLFPGASGWFGRGTSGDCVLANFGSRTAGARLGLFVELAFHVALPSD
eukprot:9466782-Pyramimonas_sp.AAC.2